MNKSSNYVQLSLLSVTVLLFGMFVFPGVYADEIISITIDLQTILLDGGEIIPLLNTNNIANMSKITLSATLPCNSSNVPDLKIIVGVLGNTTDVIDSSSDYASLRGPFDTCYFEDTVNIDTASVPALNRIFLKNDGASSVLTGLGATVSITGIISTNSTATSSTIIPGSLHNGLLIYHQMEGITNTCSSTSSNDCLFPSGTVGYSNSANGKFNDDSSTSTSGHGSSYDVAWEASDWSVCMWADGTAQAGSTYIFSTGDTSGGNHAYLKYSSTTGYDYLVSGTTVIDTSQNPSGIEHICVTNDQHGDAQLWVNAILIGSGDISGTTAVDTDAFTLGNYYVGASTGNSCGGCDIDDLAIWNRVLTNSEISDIYANGTGLEIIDDN